MEKYTVWMIVTIDARQHLPFGEFPHHSSCRNKLLPLSGIRKPYPRNCVVATAKCHRIVWHRLLAPADWQSGHAGRHVDRRDSPVYSTLPVLAFLLTP
ncbi:hypothetical protein BaRGS_00012454 [Batillaria attramentaria]|uniref:Uncharacterized protein n=1 Tax=Batillaria attramentaria TaxID=370345 RepID=A0ABD0L9P8_9CAEN